MGSRWLRHWLHHPLRDRAAAARATKAVELRSRRRRQRADAPARTRCAASPTSSASPRASHCAARARATCPGCATAWPAARARAMPPAPGAAARRAATALATPPSLPRPAARAIAPNPPRCCATAASSPPATTPSSTSCAASSQLRRLPARARSARARAHRHRNLKVEYNRVHGFYIEVSHANADKVPDDYRRRQTLKNAERYITPELKAFEDKALSARTARWRARSCSTRRCSTRSPRHPGAAAHRPRLALLDVLAAFAARARALRLVPAAVRRRAGLEIEAGRHPVVERQVDSFIANDCRLDAARACC
jgi:DNA mismatch repair protein MutS